MTNNMFRTGRPFLLAAALGGSLLLSACGGGGAPETPRFESTAVGGVSGIRDNSTGIVWAAQLGTGNLPNTAGLPYASELLTLADMDPATLGQAFPFVVNAPNAYMRAAEPVASDNASVWVVDFGRERLEPGGLSNEASAGANQVPPLFNAWYVLSRATNPVSELSRASNPGVVYEGGLVWKVCSEGAAWNGSRCDGTPQVFTHEQATARAATLNQDRFAGYNDWRLPTKQELQGLLRLGNISRSLLPEPFNTLDSLGTDVLPYWTGTMSRDRSAVWQVDFSVGQDPGGIEPVDPASAAAHIRLVRGSR